MAPSLAGTGKEWPPEGSVLITPDHKVFSRRGGKWNPLDVWGNKGPSSASKLLRNVGIFLLVILLLIAADWFGQFQGRSSTGSNPHVDWTPTPVPSPTHR